MRRFFLAALVSTALVFAWQSMTVWHNYDGDWTALFHTGGFFQLPPDLAAEEIYRFRNDPGYDGQVYHLVAHDPWMRHGFAAYADNPRLRWRRILIPGLASLTPFVDEAYVALQLGFVFLGSYWLGRCTGRPPWCLAFPLLPAVLVSMDRMTIDTAIAALCVGFAVYLDAPRKLYVVLALAPLARETGIVLLASYCLWLAIQCHWRKMAVFATAAIPWIGWSAYVGSNTAADHTRFLGLPLAGIVGRTLHPVQYSLTTGWLRQAALFDYLAVIAIWIALALALRLAWQRRCGPLDLAVYGYAALAAILAQPQIWGDAYSLSRTQTPLLLCLALAGRSRWHLLPVLLSLPRILLQFTPQWKGILHGMLR